MLQRTLQFAGCAVLWSCLVAAAVAGDCLSGCDDSKPRQPGPNPGTRRFGPLEPELEFGYSVEPLTAVPGIPGIAAAPPVSWWGYNGLGRYYYPNWGYYGWPYRSWLVPYYGYYGWGGYGGYGYGPPWYYFNRPWYNGPSWYYFNRPWFGH